MARRVLQVVESAYRGTLEEQDDTIVWLTHALKGAGLVTDMLLRGNAVNYSVTTQDASGLEFGGRKQTQPPRLANDVAKLMEKGVTVYVVREDLETRGIKADELIDGLTSITVSALPVLFAAYEQVWHW